MVFNDPCDDIADLSSCPGRSPSAARSTTRPAPRSTTASAWHPIFATFAVVNNGAQCVGDTAFKETLTHELGHTMGFGHHDPPNPADATMSAFLKNDGRGAALAIVDKQCAAFDYHTFLDVPYSYWTWRWIEAIENAGVTTGCGNGNYCPGAAMTRDEMALFLLRAKEGGELHAARPAPPPCSPTSPAPTPTRPGSTSWCGAASPPAAAAATTAPAPRSPARRWRSSCWRPSRAGLEPARLRHPVVRRHALLQPVRALGRRAGAPRRHRRLRRRQLLPQRHR